MLTKVELISILKELSNLTLGQLWRKSVNKLYVLLDELLFNFEEEI